MSVLGRRLNRSTQHPRNAYQTLAESPSRFLAANDAKAPVSRPQFCQRVLSALTDQASLQLCNRGHLCEEEFPHRARRDAWKVAEHQIDVAGHERAEQVHVTGEPVQLLKNQALRQWPLHGKGLRRAWADPIFSRSPSRRTRPRLSTVPR
jgi:hypothetical protein